MYSPCSDHAGRLLERFQLVSPSRAPLLRQLMALFEPHPTRCGGEIRGSGAAARALSASVVDNNLVAGVYENIAWFYDITFGPALHPGRADALERLAIKPRDHVLEVGVGTGINVSLYPSDCSVTGIDLSSPMLEKARERVARQGVREVRPARA